MYHFTVQDVLWNVKWFDVDELVERIDSYFWRIKLTSINLDKKDRYNNSSIFELLTNEWAHLQYLQNKKTRTLELSDKQSNQFSNAAGGEKVYSQATKLSETSQGQTRKQFCHWVTEHG